MALAWTYGLTALRFTLAFGLSVVLAHILGPGPFGLVAVAFVVMGPGMLLVEAGAGAALIQRGTLTAEAVASAFTWQLLSGLVLSGLCVVLAPVMASALQAPAATPVLRAMAPAYLLQSVGLVSAALLKRSLRHRDVLIATTATYVVSFGLIALPLAAAGAGVWALVVAQLTQATGSSAALLLLCRHSWRLRAPWADRELLRFSNQVLRVNGLNWVIENGDNLLVGRLFGSIALGLYGRAYSTVRLPADATLTALQAVTFAGHSRVKDLATARRGYVASLNAVSLIALPLFATTAVCGPAVIIAVYGQAWAGAGRMVAPLSIAMAFHCLVAVSGPVLWARDRVRKEYVAQVVSLAVLVGALGVLSADLVQVAWAVTIAYVVRGVLMAAAAARVLEVPAALAWRSALSGARAAVLASVGVLALTVPRVPSLVLGTAGLAVCALVTTGLTFALRAPEWTDELRDTARSLGIPVLSRRLAAYPNGRPGPVTP
jgi:lipopolysaccharide exporter